MKTENSRKTIEKQGSVTRRGVYRNRVIALILSVVLAVCLVPVVGKTEEVHAEGEKEITGLGTGAITNPTNGETEGLTKWTGSYVYYGKVNNSPVKYRVLTVSTSDFNSDEDNTAGRKTMLLDCDTILYMGSPFDMDSNVWADSDIKSGLNGTGFLTKAGVFTAVEKEAIASSTKENAISTEPGDGNGYNYYGWSSLSGEKIFFLDAKEATRPTYGYKNTISSSVTRKKTLPGSSEYEKWWLRSPYSNSSRVGIVYGDGVILYGNITNIEMTGVSPAFNINLSSVIFSSLISGTAGAANAEYKLTLKDTDRTLSIPANESIVRKSINEVTVPYTIDNGSDHVSLLITNVGDTWSSTTGWSTNAVKQYYQAVAVTSAAATVTFTLPDNYEEKRNDWQVWVIPEKIKGAEETDYAGEPVAITVPYLVVFDPGEGSGTMVSQSAFIGDTFTLPECTFIAQSGRAFNDWAIDGEDGIHYPGGTVQITSNCVQNGVIIVTAHWKDHSHNWTYSASGETITASCSGAGTCDITTGLNLTISAPSAETLTYDGTAKAATLNTDYNTTAFSGENTISYYKGTSALSGAPVDAGKYKATVSIGTETAEVSYEINKADPVVIVAPIASDITYGEALSSSTISGGNVTASVSGESTNIAGIFSWETGNVEPTVADSGTTDYAALFTPADAVNFKPTTVNLKLAVAPKEVTVAGITAKDKVYDGNDTAELDLSNVVITGLLDRDKNKVSVTAKGKFENADAGKNKKVIISDLKLTGDAASNYVLAGTGNQTEAAAEIFKLDSRIKEIPVAKTGLVYTGSKQELITKGTAENGTLVYVLTEKGADAPDDSKYGTEIPATVDAGTYTVYYKVTGGINYNDAPVVKLDVVIKKASQEAPVLTSTDETESGKNDGTITGLTTDMEISATGKDNGYHPVTEATITGAQYAPGTYYVRYAGDKNHEPSEPYVITIKKGADPDDDDYYIPSYPDYIPPKNDKKESKFTPGIKKTVTENIDGSVTTVTIVTGFDGRVTETTVTEWPSGKKDTKEVVTDRDGNVLSVMTEKVRFNKKKQTKTVTTVIEKADGYSLESVETTYVSGKVVKVTTEITPKKTKKYIKETKKKDGSVTTESVETKVDGKTTLKSTAKGTDDIETVKIYAVKEDGTVRLESLITGKKTAIVPATVTFNGVTYVVNSIARGAFEGNTTLKTVKIGLNILYIRSGAFEGAENLKNIYMDVTNLKKVFMGAFDGISPKAKFTLTAPDKKTFRRARKKLWNSGVPKNMPIKSGK